MPPIASTGIGTDPQISARRSTPCGAPNRSLRRRREDRTKEDVVGSTGCRRLCALQRMAGDTDQKIFHGETRLRRSVLTSSTGKLALPQVDSRRAFGQCDVDTVVDENACRAGTVIGPRRGSQQALLVSAPLAAGRTDPFPESAPNRHLLLASAAIFSARARHILGWRDRDRLLRSVT